MVRVLGIDLGIANTGWAVVRKETRRCRCVDSRYIQRSARLSLGEWLGIIIEGRWSRSNMADIIGIEKVHFAKNVSSALSTANVIGTVDLTADQASKSCG